jgi:Transposase DDE domain
MKACGLSDSYLPSRRTFDRRLKTISNDIKGRIAAMGNLFVFEGLVEPYVIAIDSTLLKSKGHAVWHASSMSKGIIPRSGIDTDSRWGFSHTRGWIFGYKLHMVSSTDSLIVPLVAGVTTANIPDNHVYPDLLSSPSSPSSPNNSNSNSNSLSLKTLKKIHFVAADPGYDDKSLYDLSMKMGFQLVCPVKRYKNTPEERQSLADFYESALGQVIYSKRCISIEPLIEHIKSIFRIDPVPARGYDKVRGILLLSVLLYQLLVYYNCKIQKKNNPRRMLKYMLGC